MNLYLPRQPERNARAAFLCVLIILLYEDNNITGDKKCVYYKFLMIDSYKRNFFCKLWVNHVTLTFNYTAFMKRWV